ncbi:MAG: ATP-binding protein [Deltaproteobacteria bacterium]|nr:ATP-binding protein [Deltaproteobacteria bacterium]
MKRFSEKFLVEWFERPHRKPLILRGARQVGKSTLVRNFAASGGFDLIEINLERNLRLNPVFKTNDGKKILAEIEAASGKNVHAKEALLFLDEIQATPDAIPALRYLHEDMPELPIVAAGSLLEFVLARHGFSMPVGRIEFFHLGPMTFKEFLLAQNDESLVGYLEGYRLGGALPEMAHERLLLRQREYLFVGGMPEAVLVYSQSASLTEAQRVHRSVMNTYEDDFAKYTRQASELNRLHSVLGALPKIIGCKVKYSQISREEQSKSLRLAIDLLVKARLLLPAHHSACSGVPLKASADPHVFKLFFLDVGLFNYLCGMEWGDLSRMDETRLVNEGVLAEQFIAQHLAYRHEGLESPDLTYWLREGKTSNAEVDFAAAVGDRIFPIEVKAGTSGGLKSLQQFVLKKKTPVACRFDLNLPSTQKVRHQTLEGGTVKSAEFNLVSLPLYLVEETLRLLKTA